MRVISGTARGHKLKAPEGLHTRPTADRIKEDLFNILPAVCIKGTAFLDLYSGSGAIGIEALSRGAGLACFVDNNKAAIKVITENITRTRLAERGEIIHKPVMDALAMLAKHGRKFSAIFMDPPYNSDEWMAVLDIAGANGLLEDGGICIVECAKKSAAGTIRPAFDCFRIKEYTQSRLLFFRMISE